jgi:hypothetical protein
MKTRTGLAMVVAMLLAGAGMVRTAMATTLTEGDLDDRVMGTSDGNFTGRDETPIRFNWNDKNGDGVEAGGTDTVSGGLAMGTLNLDRDTDDKGFRLLNVNGPIAYTGSGGALTADDGSHHHDAGDIQITGARTSASD